LSKQKRWKDIFDIYLDITNDPSYNNKKPFIKQKQTK